MKLAEFVRKERSQRNESLRVFGKRIGVSQTYVADLESGKRDNPTISTVKKLASLVGQDIDAFLNSIDEFQIYVGDEEQERPQRTDASSILNIPVYSRMDDGFEEIDLKDLVGYELMNPEEKTVLGLRMEGSSMDPEIPEGSVVLFQVQPDIKSGDLAVVSIDGKAAVCQLVITKQGMITRYLNPMFQPVFYDLAQADGLPEVIGKVIEVRKKY